jgi:hypothetical protein
MEGSICSGRRAGGELIELLRRRPSVRAAHL